MRECKKKKGLRTTRRVPLSGYLKQTLQDWLQRHPGGPMLFELNAVWKGKEVKLNPTLLSMQLKRLTRGTKWKNLRGRHVLRHSFVSACAAEGVDQRVLQSWVGHLSAVTHKRYTHLVPSREAQIMSRVFG